jgi:putative flippase GtrA
MTPHRHELLRYVANGLVATGVHFGVLSFNLHTLRIESAGLANLMAAIFGIVVSFLGSRYFVFLATKDGLLAQAAKFSGLYAAIALLHGSILYVWSDFLRFDYRVGFLIATGVQIISSYLGNKFLVFKK